MEKARNGDGGAVKMSRDNCDVKGGHFEGHHGGGVGWSMGGDVMNWGIAAMVRK